MRLPDALAPWAAQLELLPEDLALAVGPLLVRIAASIGPFRNSSIGLGEPDGYDGIDRRGSYERLLVSEWAVGEVSPEEFFRRATRGEHSFLRTAERSPGGLRVCQVILDAGPEQVGKPRIAQLALLIVLERRARAAGASFTWAVVPGELGKPVTVHAEITATSIRTWLEGRSLRRPSPEDWNQAALALQASASEQTKAVRPECWVIGGSGAEAYGLLQGLRQITIREPLAAGGQRLELRVKEPGRAATPIDLELPAEGQCVRLLRDPLKAATENHARASGRFAPLSHLGFSSGGQKVLARCAGGMVAFPIPNSPREPLGKPKLIKGEVLRSAVALGWSRGRGMGAELRGKSLILGGRTGDQWWGAGRPFPLNSVEIDLTPEESSQLGQLRATQNRDTWWIEIPGRALIQVTQAHSPQGNATVAVKNLLACAFAADTIDPLAVYFEPTPSSTTPVTTGNIVWAQPGKESYRIPYLGTRAPRVILGGTPARPGSLLALESTAGNWTVRCPSGSFRIATEAAATVFAVAWHSVRGEGLIALESDRCTLRFVGPRNTHEILHSQSPILHATLCARSDRLAVLTADGILEVFSLTHWAHLARIEVSAFP